MLLGALAVVLFFKEKGKRKLSLACVIYSVGLYLDQGDVMCIGCSAGSTRGTCGS